MIDMVYIFFVISAVAFVIAFLMTRNRVNQTFHYAKYEMESIEKSNKNESVFYDILTKIVCEKLRTFQLDYSQTVDKQSYEKLEVLDGYFYKIDCKKMTDNYLKMLLSCIVSTKQNVNVFLFDCMKKIRLPKSKKVKIFYCDLMDISIQTLGIINTLNCNKAKTIFKNKKKQKKQKNIKTNIKNNYILTNLKKYSENIKNSDNIRVSSFFKNNIFNIYCESKNKKTGYIYLQINFKNYQNIFIKKRNKIIIKNIFNEVVFEILFKGNVYLYESGLILEIRKNCVIQCEQTLNDFQQKFLYAINYKILQESVLGSKVNYLLTSSIKQLNFDYFFVLDNCKNIVEFDFKNINNFFLLSNLKRDYLRRYFFALETFYGIKILQNGDFVFSEKKHDIDDFDLLISRNGKTKIFQFRRETQMTKLYNKSATAYDVEKLPDSV